MKQKKKTIMIAIIILLVLSVAIGISYAYWILNLNQDSKNIVSTKCLNVTFTEGDAINLQKTYPMKDEDGAKLIPYTFTLKNECNDKANYQINLETLTDSTLDINYVKVKLNDEISVLGSKEAVTKTLDNATDSRMLETGILNANETKTFNLNIWLSYDAPNDTMNKTFESKITVTTSYHAITAVDVIKDLVARADSSSTDVYTVPDKISDSCTYTLAYDGTSDNNLRYVGANPCNYVKVDDEYWRIIGVMNNIDDGTGKKESRIKLIRDESIGNYSWDTSDSNVNNGNGVNEWSQADLMKLLNPGYETEEVGGSLYYNGNAGNCYNGRNNATKSCDFTSTGLKSKLKGIIDNVLWNIGSNGTNDYYSSKSGLSKHFYNLERSDNTGKICTSGTYCNDTVERTTEWQGKVGLMYPSDYGYATSGGSANTREICLNKELVKWIDDYNDCKSNSWIATPNSQNTISPYAYYANNSYVCSISGTVSSSFSGGAAYGNGPVYPVVYLVSNVKALWGEGTKENPYELGV